MTNVGHVIVTFTVNGKVSVETPVDMELRQQWGQHDLMFVRLVVPKGKEANLLKAWPDGSAVAVRWGQNPGAGIITWYGYINHHAINTSDDAAGQNVQITYVLIGTSKVMNPDKNRTWVKYTITAMAQKMAKDYSFRCVVTQSSWVLAYEVQANESDFAFMNRMAAKTGFRFWVSGGTLYCIDPIVLLAGQTSGAVPTYTINKDPYTTDPAQDFEIQQGDSLPGSTTLTRTVYGVDMHTPGYPVFKVQPDSPVKPDSPPPSTTYQPADMMITSSRHVTSRAQAKQLMNASQALTQFWVVATVQVFGNTLLYPGKAINLKGTAVPNNNNMGWIVTAADHAMVFSQNQDPTRDRYVTRLTIVTNQKSSTVPHINGIHQIAPEIIGCTLAGNIWHSATQNVVIEGIIPS